jgi:NAD(P)-dependent dehydrogenase (short-subunit alcohol dehydrogenase family)
MPNTEQLNRTVLITGATRGIGRASAEAFAERGWRVVAGVRTPDRLEAFEEPGIHVVRLDVTDSQSVRTGVAEAQDVAGGVLDCVVNNAGWALFGAVEDVGLDDARREFETNVFGAVAVLQEALPAMRAARAGVVVSVSTVVGRVPLPMFGMYGATKVSLAALSEALALEVAPFGVRVVLIEAGVVATDFARSTVISGSAADAGSAYAPVRDGVLARIRGIREETPIDVVEVASAIVRAAEDRNAPPRIVLADEGLWPLIDAVGGPDLDALEHVRAFLGLEGPPSDGSS